MYIRYLKNIYENIILYINNLFCVNSDLRKNHLYKL